MPPRANRDDEGNGLLQSARLKEKVVAAVLQRPGESLEHAIESAGGPGGLMSDIAEALFEAKADIRPNPRPEFRRRGRRIAIGELHALLLYGAFLMKANAI
jgi:hypothetical protein